MDIEYEELLRNLKKLEEGMTKEALSKLTTEQLCDVMEQVAEIKGKLAVLKNNESEEE